MYNKKDLIILTGGAGFIGSCFLWKLNQEGASNIIVVDSLDKSIKWKNLSGKRFVDYVDKDDFIGLLESGRFNGIKALVHFGACSSTILDDADYFLRNNFEYSKRIASWAYKHSTRFVYASSAATYGNGSCGYDDAEEKLYDLKPLNIYGFTKHLFDLWMLNNGLFNRAVGLKFFNVFGPNEYHKGEMMSIICKRFNDTASGKPIRLFKSYNPAYADGGQKRDFIYVKDVVEVAYFFLVNPKKAGIFNLGSGKAVTWNQLAEAMFVAAGRKPEIEYIDMPQELKDKYQYFTQADMGKLRSCGYRRKFTPLEEAIKDYTSYLRSGAYL